MARGKIQKSDLISNDVKKGLQELRNEIDLTVKSFKELKSEAKAINKEIKSAKTFNEVSDKAGKASTNVKKLTKEEQRLKKATAELNFQLSKEGKELAKVNERKNRAAAANRKMAKSQAGAAKSTNTFGKAIGSFLFKANFMANVMANVASAVTRFAKKIITDGIRGVVSFDAAITDVKAVAQATDEQFKQLRESAIALGGATKFTATQVATLQKEFAKLGFTADQIIQLQDATLQLATATGAELAPAAKVVGGALRSFGKDVRDAESVAATLAIATTKSALAFEDYETILSTVAPVANAYNFSLEDTIALLGQLKNANFDSSKASTATRNILLNLADSNGALAKALGGSVSTLEEMVDGLIQLREEGVDLATTLELTDKRSVAAFNTFLIGAENALVLKDQITGVNEELDEMVNIQLGSLENKVTLLSSAWQGLTQQLADSVKGADAAKGAVGGLTRVLQGTTGALKFNEEMGFLGKTLQILSPIIFFQTQKHIVLGKAIKGTKKETEELTKVIQEGEITEFTKDLGLLRIAQDELNKTSSDEQIKETNAAVKDYSDLLKELENESVIDEDDVDLLGLYNERLNKIVNDGLTALEKKQEQIDADKLEQAKEDLELEDKVKESMLQKEAEYQKKKSELIKQYAQVAFDFLLALNARATENKAAQANEELAIIDSRLTEELNDESLTADQRLEINDRYAAERAVIEERSAAESLKLRRQAAVIEKASAIFSIALDTAKGVMKYGSNPITAALVPYIIGLGLAQTAVVATTPLPKFAKGTDSSPEGLAVVGEKGSELMIDKKGNVSLSPDKASLTYLDKGTQIIPSDVTQSLLAYDAMKSSYDGKTDILLKRNNTLLERIAMKPVSSSTMTPSGILTAVHKGNTTIKKIDKYFG